MDKTEIENLLDKLGVDYVKSTNDKPLTNVELEELRKTLSKTNLVDLIDRREV